MTDQWKQISGLYHEALKLPEDEREAFLKKHAPDEGIRQEVKSLLANDNVGEKLLNSPALEVAARMTANEDPVSLAGKTLNHYQVTGLIGKGGMGEVYKAKDQKLGRDVAIKTLPDEFAWDADRVARFQREAKLLASLSHPNIAAIHGLEEAGSKQFLVLELVEGETLATRLKRGPIPVEESLKIALQIAEALEAAHERGVIHRDLKPANIKITPEGRVKVLDFGLAKVYAGNQENADPSDSPTISDMITKQGIILGTAAYMSPEQARGKSVDRRTDIWAFGCVLYEMLTGRAAFRGEDVSEILASVIKGDLELDFLPANLHPRICEAINRCLKKDQNRRYQDIRDAQYEIDQALTDTGGLWTQSSASTGPRTGLKVILPWISAAIIMAAVITGMAVWRLKPPEPKPVLRFAIELADGQKFNQDQTLGSLILAVSPDGNQIVYATTEGLYLRSLDSMEARPIKGTDKDSIEPFFSPDGKWIGYWSSSESRLKKIAVSGGVPEVLCSTNFVLGASWNPDNSILYSDSRTGIMRISAEGGTPESLVKGSFLDLKEGFPALPQMLPDGKTLLFTYVVDLNMANWQVMAQSLISGERKVVLKSGYLAGYLPTKHLVYALENNGINGLYSIAFDLDKLEVKGGPVPVIDNIRAGAFSETGTLAYIRGNFKSAIVIANSPGNTLVWVDREGKEESLDAPPGQYSFPSISLDGTQVAVAVGPLNYEDISIWDVNRKILTPLTFDKTREIYPVWTTDGKRIIFYSNHESRGGGVYWKAADGTGDIGKLISETDRTFIPLSCSIDGRTLVMQETDSSTKLDLSMLTLDGELKRTVLVKTENNEGLAKISPDGSLIAYCEVDNLVIYICPFPEVSKGKWKVSDGAGMCPLWSPDGSEVYYLGEGSVMAVSVEKGQTPRFGTPKKLFKNIYVGPSVVSGNPWAIHPDGRFLMIKPPALSGTEPTTSPQTKINIVFNWLEELKRKVPVE